jgi:saccharopine dehydrogenase-like NADP-dependent oxidoreductase
MFDSRITDRRNYRSLILAGIGTIGGSLITLGPDQLALFEYIYAVDKKSTKLAGLQDSGIICRAGDVTAPAFLDLLVSDVPGPALFVNLCSGTDHIRIRQNLIRHDCAYLDSCASITENPDECRFSRLMPYTYARIDTQRPHWLCWGINPGLVEIVARRILAGLPDRSNGYDVAIYEFDRLKNIADNNRAAVGWCPEDLVEEVMLSPTLMVVDGHPREDPSPGARDCLVNWDDRQIPARIVAHEDIWNLAEIAAVRNSSFFYSLNPAVMEILHMDDAEKARNLIYTPTGNDPVSGLEQVAVQVNGKKMSAPKTLVWTEDHAETWSRFEVNAVQYQTSKSMLLAVMLLQCTHYGLVPHSNNAANLPITAEDWEIFDSFMQELDIDWQDGSHLNLYPTGI